MTLIVMAAGMGSRYGGLKQLDPIGPNGEFILDYSIMDAKKAGFDKVVFVIKEENLEAFKETVGNRISRQMKVRYAFQRLDKLPEGFSVPAGRVKQWGTGHAALCAEEYAEGGVAIINADDLYGEETFRLMHDFLASEQTEACGCMAGFVLKNTLTENGTVARGVVTEDENGMMADIQERTKIGRQEDGSTAYLEYGEWHPVDENSIVSMNAWALTEGFFASARRGFKEFLTHIYDPTKVEYYLPTAVRCFMEDTGKPIKVLHTDAKWYGVTYREDKQAVVDYIAECIEKGQYPGKQG